MLIWKQVPSGDKIHWIEQGDIVVLTFMNAAELWKSGVMLKQSTVGSGYMMRWAEDVHYMETCDCHQWRK